MNYVDSEDSKMGQFCKMFSIPKIAGLRRNGWRTRTMDRHTTERLQWDYFEPDKSSDITNFYYRNDAIMVVVSAPAIDNIFNDSPVTHYSGSMVSAPSYP